MNVRRVRGRALLALLVSLWLATPAAAQTQDEPLYERLVAAVKTDYLRLGVLFQSVADLQFERSMPGANGFSVANFRVSLSGELDRRFGYFLQTNFAGTPSILDASMSYGASENVRLEVGRFKAPFSAEFLVSASSIDFVNRAQAVTALAPGRQIGAQGKLTSSNGRVGAAIGVFNGNDPAANGNDSDDFLVAARLAGSVPLEREQAGGRVAYGVNVARSTDASASFGQGFVTGFSGTRTVVGGDLRVTVDRVLLAAEVNRAILDPTIGPTRKPWGGHATVGYQVRERNQLLARFDFFDPDDGLGRSDWLVLGWNAWPTAVTEFQVNYVVDTGQADFDNHQLLVNFQFGF